jgi:hypothetical protein
MSAKLSPDCTYKTGDETCVRTKCPISCMRNYEDQADTDIPLVSQAKKEPPKPVSWWWSHFGSADKKTVR